MAILRAATPIPTLHAEYGKRRPVSRSRHKLSPPPSGPSRCEAGTRHSSRWTTLGNAAVRSTLNGRAVKPGCRRTTEYSRPRIVETHAMLAHLFLQHAHLKHT